MIRPVGNKALGYQVISGPDGVQETDLFTCQHCNCVVAVQPFHPPEDMGGICKGCMGLICKGCLKRSRMNEYGGCDHIQKKLERIEKNLANDFALRSYGLVR